VSGWVISGFVVDSMARIGTGISPIIEVFEGLKGASGRKEPVYMLSVSTALTTIIWKTFESLRFDILYIINQPWKR